MPGSPSPRVAYLRARVAGLSHSSDRSELPRLRRELAVENLIEAIARTVAEHPDLTAAERHRLASPILGGGAL